jgi:hypothetical protein
MPGGDGTGPMGMGPMTGRAAGYCAGYPVPGFMNPMGMWGLRGFGRGRGGGRGRRHWFYATGLTGWQRAAAGIPAWSGGLGYTMPYAPVNAPVATREQQLNALKGQAEYFEDALDGIRKRIEELEAQGKQA